MNSKAKSPNNAKLDVFELLRSQITSLELMPGSPIDVSSLRRKLSVSITPIRDALKRLTERQLLTFTPGSGYHVIALTSKEIEDAFRLRMIIEISLLPRAVELVPLTRVKQVRAKMLHLSIDTLSGSKFRSEFDRLDDELHQGLIVRSSGNRFATMAIEVTGDFLAIARHLNDRIPESILEHIYILDAWMDGNTQEATRLLSLHLKSSLTACISPRKQAPHEPVRSSHLREAA